MSSTKKVVAPKKNGVLDNLLKLIDERKDSELPQKNHLSKLREAVIKSANKNTIRQSPSKIKEPSQMKTPQKHGSNKQSLFSHHRK